MARNKINATQVSRLRWFFGKQFTIKQWAEVLGVTETAIKDIKTGKSYKEVKPKTPIAILQEAVQDHSLHDALAVLAKYHGKDEVKKAADKL